jgi:putative transcriptional regulator
MRRPKGKFMSDETFNRVVRGFEQAAAHARGEKIGARITTIQVPPPPKPRTAAQIVATRRNIKCSQSTFAQMLNVSVKTVQAWEQGIRKPSDAALKLLAIAEKHPEVLLDSQ